MSRARLAERGGGTRGPLATYVSPGQVPGLCRLLPGAKLAHELLDGEAAASGDNERAQQAKERARRFSGGVGQGSVGVVVRRRPVEVGGGLPCRSDGAPWLPTLPAAALRLFEAAVPFPLRAIAGLSSPFSTLASARLVCVSHRPQAVPPALGSAIAPVPLFRSHSPAPAQLKPTQTRAAPP